MSFHIDLDLSRLHPALDADALIEEALQFADRAAVERNRLKRDSLHYEALRLYQLGRQLKAVRSWDRTSPLLPTS